MPHSEPFDPMTCPLNDNRIIDCEGKLLGGLMQAGVNREGVLSRLRPEDFSTDAHQIIARTIRDLCAERVPVELVTIADRLRKNGGIERLGETSGLALQWLVDVFESDPSGMLVDYHAAEVLNAAKTRALVIAARGILSECLPPQGSAVELVNRAAAKIETISEKGLSEDRLRTSAEATNAALDEIDRRTRGETFPGIQTGLSDLDAMTGGIPHGQLAIIAARPSVGKTALSLQIARHAAKEGTQVLFASLEQSTLELGTRALAQQASVCGQMLRLGKKLLPEEIRRMARASDVNRALPIIYDDTPGQNVMHILATARRIKRANGLGLIVVDYLQNMNPENSKDNRNNQLDVITRHIREMARELNVAVIALSQLSRDVEKQNRRPRLSDLRDSGALEQHADVVMMLHRPERTGGDVDPVEVGIEKQRNGPTGLVNLCYRRKTLTFENGGTLIGS